MISTFTQRALKVLGKLIKAARVERNMSQADIAERLAVTRQTIHGIEKGNANVSIGTVFEVAYLLGIPLFSDNDEKSSKWQTLLNDFSGLLPKRAGRKKRKINNAF